MRAALPFRVCAVMLLLFAVGHTYGFLHFIPSTAAGVAVKTAMDGVAFPLGKAQRSYGDFYRGFGLFITAYLLFAAVIAFQLPRLLLAAPESFWLIAVGFLLVQMATSIVALTYFALPPATLSGAIVLCLAWGLLLAKGPKPSPG